MTKTVQTVDQCPYRTVRHVHMVPFEAIEERFDFQIGDSRVPEIISIGKFDLPKEVDSHKDEVGLINVLRLAEARGISLDTYAKTEPGVMADVGDIDTFDDLLNAKAEADAKLAGIAKSYGMTTEQLIQAVKNGEKLTASDVEKVEDKE